MEVEKRYMSIKWILLSIVVLITVFLMMSFVEFPVHAETNDPNYVIVFDYVNWRYIKGTTNGDGNTYHPDVAYFDAYEDMSGNIWTPLPPNTRLPNRFGSDSYVSCVFQPPSDWAFNTYKRIAASSMTFNTMSIPYPENWDAYSYKAIFMAGDGLIYAAMSSNTLLYLKNKDSRGTYGVYNLVPDYGGTITLYQWTGEWAFYGQSSWGNTSLTDGLAIATLYTGAFTWDNFTYYDDILSLEHTTDNYGNYGGSLPSFDIKASRFEGSLDAPVDPEEPTPTPAPSQSSYIILRFCPRGYTSDHGMTYGYVCIELEGTLGEINISQLPLLGNEALSYAMSNYGVGSDWMRTVFLRSVSDRNSFYLVTGGTYSNIRYYYIGSSLVSTDLAFIKENYSPKVSSSSYGAGYWSYTFSFYKNKGLSAFGIWYNSNYGFDIVYYSGFGDVRQENNLDINYFLTSAEQLINPSGTSSSNILTQAYRFGNDLNYVPEPSPTPTPDPNATPTPTLSPTPTEPPHVIINWPTNTPMPTPSIRWQPPGDKDSDLSGDQSESIFNFGLDWFRSGMNGGLLSKAFSFVPPELQWLIWFLVFVLLVLAVIKLIIHFGG